MKRASVKILLIILFTGIICIVGELLMSYQFDRFEDMHEEIMHEYVQNREYMSQISTYLYEHQAILSNYALTDSNEARMDYEKQELEIREKLADLIIDFSYRMKGGDRERIYHRVYSNFSGYEENSGLFLQFCKNGEMDMAVYYNDNVLEPHLVDINQKLADLDELTVSDISNAEQAINVAIRVSNILRVMIVIIVALFFALCIYVSVSITGKLDKYKESLERELIEKNRTIQERNENMLKLQDSIIYSMANLIESRDGETGEHVKRTSAYVEMIAEAAKAKGLYTDVLTDEYIERLVKVAPLHDVGKIAVPDQILMKPGRLTESEFEIIKLHASKGEEIIKVFFENIEDREYVQMASDVAGYHHEKWNGSGYCRGISGEDIPLSARIMALADVFDALISKRRYKDAFSLDEAFDIMKESGGTHFDPGLTDVFLEIRPEIEGYLNSLEGEK